MTNWICSSRRRRVITTYAHKVCHACKAQIHAQARHDPEGRPYCVVCWGLRAAGAAMGSGEARPAPRMYECTFCRRKIAETEVHYHAGEIACRGCYHNAVAATEVPMAPCHQCGGAVARQFMTVVDGKRYCQECGEAARIEYNQRQQYRRQAFANIRFVYGIAGHRPSGGGVWAARVIGALVILALVGLLVQVVISGIRESTKPARVTFVDGEGNQMQLTRSEARERLAKDPEGRVKVEGMVLSREDAERLVK